MPTFGEHSEEERARERVTCGDLQIIMVLCISARHMQPGWQKNSGSAESLYPGVIIIEEHSCFKLGAYVLIHANAYHVE